MMALIGAVGLGAVAFTAAASPLAPPADAHRPSNITLVWGGCGWGFHPVPGHWSRWRGAWVPPHCAPNHYGYSGYGYPYDGYSAGVGYPYAGYPGGYRSTYWGGY